MRLIEKIHLGSRGTCGSPRVHAVLSGMQDVNCSEPRTARLMRKHGIRTKAKRKFRTTTDSSHKLPVAENVLGRKFDPESPNAAWAGDITYLWTQEG